MNAPTPQPLPTYTLIIAEIPDHTNRLTKVIPATIAIGLAIIVAVTCIAAICQHGNSKRKIIYRKDIDDAEDLQQANTTTNRVEQDATKLRELPANVSTSAQTPAQRNVPFTQDEQMPTRYNDRPLPPFPPSANPRASSGRSSPHVPNPSFSVRSPTPRAADTGARTVNSYGAYSVPHGYYPDRRGSYGDVASTLPSHLDLGSRFEGSVRLSRVMDRRNPEDPY